MKFYRLKEVPFLYPVVSFELVSVPVRAQSRRIRATWTPELAQDLEYMAAFDPAVEMEVITEEFQPRRRIMSRYATRMVNNRYYSTIQVTPEENKFTGLIFGKLKVLPLLPTEPIGSEAFEAVQLPIVRRAFAKLVCNEPRLDVVENTDGTVYASLRQWAELIDRQNNQIIGVSSRKRVTDDLVR